MAEAGSSRYNPIFINGTERQQKEAAEARVEAAIMAGTLGKDQRHFVQMLPQVSKSKRDGKFYQSAITPYVSVDGRVAAVADTNTSILTWMNVTDEPVQIVHGDTMLIVPPSHAVALAIQRDADGSVVRMTTGTEAIRTGDKAQGADRTHAVANAETSAIGRALGSMGYGLIPGSGLTTAEVMKTVPVRETDDDDDEPEQKPARRTRREKAAEAVESVRKVASGETQTADDDEDEAKDEKPKGLDKATLVRGVKARVKQLDEMGSEVANKFSVINHVKKTPECGEYETLTDLYAKGSTEQLVAVGRYVATKIEEAKAAARERDEEEAA